MKPEQLIMNWPTKPQIGPHTAVLHYQKEVVYPILGLSRSWWHKQVPWQSGSNATNLYNSWVVAIGLARWSRTWKTGEKRSGELLHRSSISLNGPRMWVYLCGPCNVSSAEEDINNQMERKEGGRRGDWGGRKYACLLRIIITMKCMKSALFLLIKIKKLKTNG